MFNLLANHCFISGLKHFGTCCYRKTIYSDFAVSRVAHPCRVLLFFFKQIDAKEKHGLVYFSSVQFRKACSFLERHQIWLCEGFFRSHRTNSTPGGCVKGPRDDLYSSRLQAERKQRRVRHGEHWNIKWFLSDLTQITRPNKITETFVPKVKSIQEWKCYCFCDWWIQAEICSVVDSNLTQFKLVFFLGSVHELRIKQPNAQAVNVDSVT